MININLYLIDRKFEIKKILKIEIKIFWSIKLRGKILCCHLNLSLFMNDIIVKGTSIFSGIVSKTNVYTCFQLLPESSNFKYYNILKLIEDLSSLLVNTAMIDHFSINSQNIFYILVLADKIFLIDYFNFKNHQKFFTEKKSLFFYFSDKSEEEFQASLKLPQSNNKQADFYNFNKDELSLIENAIINCVIKRSQILTQRRHEKNDSSTIKPNSKFNINDFIDIKYFSNNVRLCYNLNDQFLYILKSFDKKDEEANKYYKREINFYNTISNKNQFICKFFGTIEEKQENSIIIEYINGQTLEDFITQSAQKLTRYDKLKIIFKIIITMEFIHLKEMILRDLKWDNLIIDSNNDAIFIDFDRARKEYNENESQELTTNFGYEHFIAPEQYLKGQYSFKSDIFSIGMIIHFILNGQKYDDVLTISNLSDLYESKKSVLTIESVSKVPDEYKYLFNSYKKCFEFSPENRPSITELFYSILNCVKYKYKDDLTKYKSLLDIRKKCIYAAFGIESFDQETLPKNYPKIIKYLRLASNFNDDEAQYFLGKLHYFGKYLPFNSNKIIQYFLLSANQNNINSLYWMGIVYFDNEISKRNIQKAIYYFERASELNHPSAQILLARIYFDNEFVPRDITKAIYYGDLASKNNLVQANMLLGFIYFHGQYVQKNMNKAMHYLTLAADQNDKYAQLMVGKFYFNEEYVPINMNKSIHYLTLAANQGLIEAQRLLGKFYYNGQYIHRDIKKSIHYLTLAANQDDLNSIVLLAKTYYNGKLVPVQIDKAVHYFELASKKNHVQSQYILGTSYYLGHKTPKDINKAIYYLTLAANQNDEQSQIQLGHIFLGEDVPRDISRSIYYYSMASNQGNAIAQYNLGIFYLGEYAKCDISKAIHYLKLSSSHNYLYSNYVLGVIYFEGKYNIKRNIFEGIRYLTLSANQCCIPALLYLGNVYIKGKYITKNVNKGIQYYATASSLNNSDAQFRLGYLYYIGKNVKKDMKKAIHYFELASKNENRDAQLYLGTLYYEGNYIQRDIQKAIHLFKECAPFKSIGPKNNLGIIYKNGEFVKKNISLAIEYFNEAITNERDIFSYYNLSRIYYFGEDVEKDEMKAYELLEKVAHYFFFYLAFMRLIAENNDEIKIRFQSFIDRNHIDKSKDVYPLCFYTDLPSIRLFYKNYDMFYPFEFDYLESKLRALFDNNKYEPSKPKPKKKYDINELFYEGFALQF